MTIAQAAANRTVDLIREKVGAMLVAATQPHADTLRLQVDKRAVRLVAGALANELGARFMITTGIDRRELGGDFGIVHLFSLDREHLFVLLDCAVASNDEHIDSITPVVPARTGRSGSSATRSACSRMDTPTRADCCSPTTGRTACTRCGATCPTTSSLRRPKG